MPGDTHATRETRTYTVHTRAARSVVQERVRRKTEKLGCATSELTAPIPSYSLNELLELGKPLGRQPGVAATA